MRVGTIITVTHFYKWGSQGMVLLSVWPRVTQLSCEWRPKMMKETNSRTCSLSVLFTTFLTWWKRTLWLESQRLFPSTMGNMVDACGVWCNNEAPQKANDTQLGSFSEGSELIFPILDRLITEVNRSEQPLRQGCYLERQDYLLGLIVPENMGF